MPITDRRREIKMTHLLNFARHSIVKVSFTSPLSLSISDHRLQSPRSHSLDPLLVGRPLNHPFSPSTHHVTFVDWSTGLTHTFDGTTYSSRNFDIPFSATLIHTREDQETRARGHTQTDTILIYARHGQPQTAVRRCDSFGRKHIDMRHT